MPGVANILVVSRNDALVERRATQRLEREIRTGARVCNLRLGDDSQCFVVVTFISAVLRGWHSRRNVRRVRPIEIGVRSGAAQIYDGIVNTASIIRAGVIV